MINFIRTHKNTILIYLLVILISLLSIILLEEDYMMAMYFINISLGLCPFFIGMESSMHYVRLSLGKTRRQLMSDYVKNSIVTLVISIIICGLMLGFSYLVYANTYVTYLDSLFKCLDLYVFALALSTLGMMIGNLYKTKLGIMGIIVYIACIFALFILSIIKEMYVICIIINASLTVINFIINKLIFKYKKL